MDLRTRQLEIKFWWNWWNIYSFPGYRRLNTTGSLTNTSDGSAWQAWTQLWSNCAQLYPWSKLMLTFRGPFHKHELILTSAWISNDIYTKVWTEITHAFTIWCLRIDKWFHLTLYDRFNYLSMPGLKLIMLVKGTPGMTHIPYVYLFLYLLDLQILDQSNCQSRQYAHTFHV